MTNANDAKIKAMDDFAMGMFDEIGRRAEPILLRKMRAEGVDDLKALDREQAAELLKASLREAAIAHFPGTDFVAMERGLDAFFDHCFLDAFSKARAELGRTRGAFDPASGPAIATVLAGLGLEVAPLDKKNLRRLAEPSRDFRKVANTFDRFKTAYVGYNSATAPLYAVVTDDHESLNRLLASHPALADMKAAAARVEYDYRPATKPFQHSVLLLPRVEGDEFSSAMIDEPRTDRGSVLALAGWAMDRDVFGIENEGWTPVMLQVADVMLQTPAVWSWLNPPSGPAPSAH